MLSTVPANGQVLMTWGICRHSDDQDYITWITTMSHRCHDASNHWKLDCLFNSWFRLAIKYDKSSKFLALCERNLMVTCGFPSQRASNAETVSMSWSPYVSLCSQNFKSQNTISFLDSTLKQIFKTQSFIPTFKDDLTFQNYKLLWNHTRELISYSIKLNCPMKTAEC